MGLFRFFILAFLCFLFSDCSTLQTYFKNRALDFTDILTLGGEMKTAGGSFWFWCLGGGVQVGQFGEGYGMRNGYVGYYRTGGNSSLYNLKMGNSFLLMNSQEHIPEAYHSKRSMNKKYSHANVLFLVPTNLNVSRRSVNPYYDAYYQNPEYRKFRNICNAPLNVEMSMGLGVGGRVGFNFSELLDFVLGITTFDLMDDDSPNKYGAEDE